jgi:hypothetical protein
MYKPAEMKGENVTKHIHTDKKNLDNKSSFT